MHLEVVHSRIDIVHQDTITMALHLPSRSRWFVVAHEHRCRNNGRAELHLFVTILLGFMEKGSTSHENIKNLISRIF